MHHLMKSLAAGAALPVLAVAPVAAQQTVPGAFALAGGEGSVTGQMIVTETMPLTATLTLTFADAATGKQITDFTAELTQELHVLAVDSSLTRLVHEHVKTANSEGVFSTQMQFPAPGNYHIYADAVPEGRGQQVLRFDVAISGDADAGEPALQHFGVGDEIAVASGDYEVRIDPSQLAADEETMLHVAVLKDGAPATDLHPYLGVAAHAVLVKAGDLSYVHAHPMEDSQPMEHDGHGAHDDPALHREGHGDHAAPAPAGKAPDHDHGHGNMMATVSPYMTLFITPPGAGDYTLFLEFIGGDEVHTIAVPLELPAA